MDGRFIAEVLGTVVVVASSGLLFYYYYRVEKVRKVVNSVLFFLPSLLALFGTKTEDEKGVFDSHDAWVLLSRVTEDIKRIVASNENKSFEDVEDDVTTVIVRELGRYRKAGVKNVPNIDDPAIKTSVKIVFEQIKRALDENRAGDNK